MKSVQVVATDSKRKAAPATFPLYHIVSSGYTCYTQRLLVVHTSAVFTMY